MVMFFIVLKVTLEKLLLPMSPLAQENPGWRPWKATRLRILEHKNVRKEHRVLPTCFKSSETVAFKSSQRLNAGASQRENWKSV